MSDPQLPVPTPAQQLLSNKTYDYLKFIVTILLPAVGTFYYGLALIWGFPNAIGFGGTINLVCLFLGTLLGISTRKYNGNVGGQFDGQIDITETDTKKVVSVGILDPEDLENKDQITLKVNKQ